MSNHKRMGVLAIAIASLSVMPGWAQTKPEIPVHTQHGNTTPRTAIPDKMVAEDPDMQHDMPGTDRSNEISGTEHDSPSNQQDMSGMESGDMKMQGGSVPPDARDPHAWSGGYTLDSGPYILSSKRLLHLGDEHNFASLMVERLEQVYTNHDNAYVYDAQGWFGRDYNRLVLKVEGDIDRGRLQEARTELFWGHAVATFWDTQLGVRYDSGVGPDREWLAFGIQGLAPYWFNIDATAYMGIAGRTALRLSADYELLLTQKLILQPRVEMNLYGKRDEARQIGRGLSDATAGLRLRYEFTRQIAPYVGVEWVGRFGETADFARAVSEQQSEMRWVAGMRFWF